MYGVKMPLSTTAKKTMSPFHILSAIDTGREIRSETPTAKAASMNVNVNDQRECVCILSLVM